LDELNSENMKEKNWKEACKTRLVAM
jgi:hypothetical protein